MPSPDASGTGFEDWIGRRRVTTDVIAVDRARMLAATLDRDPARLVRGAPLPWGWHWIYFNEPVRRSALADDGHESRGDFLPSVPLPRRMWAGGRLRLLHAIRVGATLERTSTVRSIDRKEGRSGRLVFVTVEHRLAEPDGAVVLEEEQDIVYLERRSEPWTPPLEPPRPESGGAGVVESLTPASFTADEVTLFRFSALTFNGHRIHYDRDFARKVEGYPDLVVHGPLIALLLVDGAGRRVRSRGWPAAEGTGRAEGAVETEGAGKIEPVRFEYRGLQPAFCHEIIDLRVAASRGSSADRGLDVWAEHPARGVITRARLTPGQNAFR